MKVFILMVSVLGSACGATPLREVSVTSEQIEQVEHTLLTLARWNGYETSVFSAIDRQIVTKDLQFPAMSMHFVRTPVELGVPDAVGWTDGYDVWVAMVDDVGQAPTTEVSRTPLAHELIHVLFGDAGHIRHALWRTLLPEVYNALNGTDMPVE